MVKPHFLDLPQIPVFIRKPERHINLGYDGNPGAIFVGRRKAPVFERGEGTLVQAEAETFHNSKDAEVAVDVERGFYGNGSFDAPAKRFRRVSGRAMADDLWRRHN